ncbi:hypothetical protein G9A89_011891 [Geosiphon pyriformis]|nr:hypothetical protein G9A89_011891 [Geosiphon pyriformis]
MLLIKSLGRLIWGNPDNPELFQITSGQLYLVRPHSPKGNRECIFKDCQATVRRTLVSWQYQLVISRVFDEGELNLEEEQGELADEEKVFLIDETLEFRKGQIEGFTTFSWKDLSGEPDDLYEFICDEKITAHTVNTFELTVYHCMYERKYRKSHFQATDQEIQSFIYVPKPAHSSPSISTRNSVHASGSSPDSVLSSTTTPVKEESKQPFISTYQTGKIDLPSSTSKPETLTSVEATLYLFEANASIFLEHAPKVTATLLQGDSYQYWLNISDETTTHISQKLQPNMNPVFSNENWCLIWCHYDEGDIYSWSLRFDSLEKTQSFRAVFARAMFEALNETKFSMIKKEDQDYVIRAYDEDIDMPDAVPEEDSEENGTDESEDDSDRDDINTEPPEDEQHSNSQLAVGYKHDRSFVVKGHNIGVFKHAENDSMEHAASIKNIKTLSGKLFSPKKVMLHQEDSSMILMDGDNEQNLYKMDLEYGKVVEEWKVHDIIPCTNIIPENKFAQMTGEATLVGMSHNSLFRIDPRLNGFKLVDSERKQYVTKTNFSCAATDQQGHIVIGSEKGDIKLYDKLGKSAKTNLPGLGDPIIGVDVTADGKYVVATCRTYLLLVNTELKGDPDHKTGFTKSFAKEMKPKAAKLQLRPEHIKMMNVDVCFTPARFNMGESSKEKTIVTSTGPFVITWSFRRIRQGKYFDYQIKRYIDDVVADNFKYGEDRSIVVALPHDVVITKKTHLHAPTKSYLSPSKGRKSESSIVNSPW